MQCPCHDWPFNGQYHRSIKWTPLKHTLIEWRREFSHNETCAFLDLRLFLTVDCLNKIQINTIFKALCDLDKKCKALIRSIEWQRLHHPEGVTILVNAGKALAYAKRYGRRGRDKTSRKRKFSELHSDSTNPPSRQRSLEDDSR